MTETEGRPDPRVWAQPPLPAATEADAGFCSARDRAGKAIVRNVPAGRTSQVGAQGLVERRDSSGYLAVDAVEELFQADLELFLGTVFAEENAESLQMWKARQVQVVVVADPYMNLV